MKVIEDLRQCSNNSKKKMIRNLIVNTNYHCVVLHRLANALYKLHIPIIPQFIKLINRIIFSVDIDYRADLAGGFVIIHGLGLVIGAKVKSLGPLKVYQGVTIGGNNNKTRIINEEVVVQPIIYPNVILYSNSCLFGPIIIKENSVVGAGTIVTKDIEKDTMIFGKQKYIVTKINNKIKE